MDKTKTIADLKSKLEAKQTRERKQAEIETRVINALPELPHVPKRISAIEHKADASVKFEFPRGADFGAIPAELMRLLPPVPAVRFKDSCTSYFPREKIDAKEREAADDARGDLLNITPFLIVLETFQGQTENIVEWWTKLDGLLVKVECSFAGGPIRHHKVEHRDDRTGRLIETIWHVDTALHLDERDKFWASAGEPNRMVFYWTCSTDSPADDWTHYSKPMEQ